MEGVPIKILSRATIKASEITFDIFCDIKLLLTLHYKSSPNTGLHKNSARCCAGNKALFCKQLQSNMDESHIS